MIGPGIYNATIINNGMAATPGGSEYVALRCAFDELDENGDSVVMVAKVWLTEKSMGIARGQLRLCGFDCDTQDIEELNLNPDLLRNVRIKLDVQDKPKYGLQASVFMGQDIGRDRMARITSALRAAKKNDEPDVAVPGESAIAPSGDGIPF